MTQGDTPYLISPNAGLLQGQDERGSVPLGRHSGFVLMPGWKRREGCAAGTDAGGGRMGGPPCVAAAVPGGRGRGECGGARPRPERACLPRCLFYLGCAAGPVGCIAWCTVTGQWSTRSPVGGRGSAFAIWGGTTPWNPPLRFAPRDGTSPAHRPLTGPKGPGSLCWPGGTTLLEPPAALRAPRWYFAGTPAAHRAQGARFAVLARGDDPPGTPRCASRPAMVLRRHTGRSPGPRGPVRCAGPGGRPPWNPPVRFAPRDGTSPAHRPLTGPKGPGSLAGMSASP